MEYIVNPKFSKEMMKNTIFIFTRNGIGKGFVDLQQSLVNKFLELNFQNQTHPSKIIFYTDGVKSACEGSCVIDSLKQNEQKGVELAICRTRLERYGLAEAMQVGVIVGMGDIIEALRIAPKGISL